MNSSIVIEIEHRVTQTWKTAISTFALGIDNAIQRITSFLPFYSAKQIDKFAYLIAIEGEDNQNKAEAMLKQYPALITQFISTQVDMIDSAGRHFSRPLSSYEYTYWSGDIRMRHMMEKYMDDKTKSNVLKQCKLIEENGVGFTLNDEHVEHSKHFDYQPIIDAYNAYLTAAMSLINTHNGNKDAWSTVNKLWINVGKIQAEFPTYLAQEYCSNQPFTPLEKYVASFEHENLKRTVRFHNLATGKKEFWYARGRINPNLGILFTIHKGRCVLGGVCVPAHGWSVHNEVIPHDLAAIQALCKARTTHDIA